LNPFSSKPRELAVKADHLDLFTYQGLELNQIYCELNRQETKNKGLFREEPLTSTKPFHCTKGCLKVRGERLFRLFKCSKEKKNGNTLF